MFQNCDGPTIDFYNPNNNEEDEYKEEEFAPKSNVPTESKSTTTEIVERAEEGIQLNLKDLYSNKSSNLQNNINEENSNEENINFNENEKEFEMNDNLLNIFVSVPD